MIIIGGISESCALMKNIAPVLMFALIALASVVVQWRIDAARKRLFGERTPLTLDEWVAKYYAKLRITRSVFMLVDRAISDVYRVPLTLFHPDDVLSDNKYTEFLPIDDSIPTLEAILSKLLFTHFGLRWTPNRPMCTVNDVILDIAACFAGECAESEH